LDVSVDAAGSLGADAAGSDAARVLVPLQYLADAAVRDAQRPADGARPHALGGHLDDPQSDLIRQRAPVDEDAAQLIQTTLSCKHIG